jgi:hypothetical protein
MPIDDSHQRHIEETPELIRESLEQFRKQLLLLDNNEQQPKCKNAIILEEAARENATEYTDPAFRLMFLRTDLFDATLAAQRFVKYWVNRKGLFGQVHTLSVDPVTLDRGYARLVRNHDRVVVLDPTRVAEESDRYDREEIVRSLFYVLSQAVYNSVAAQQRGLVYLVDCENALALKYFDRPLIRRAGEVFNDGFPVRVTAVIILNLHPVGRWFVNAFRFLMKPVVRQRLRVVGGGGKNNNDDHDTNNDTENENNDDRHHNKRSYDKLDRYAGLDRAELTANLGYEPWKGQ